MTGPESGPERTLTADEDDPHIIVERCGSRCYICDEIVHSHGLEGAEDDVLVYPVHPDYPPYFGIAVCGGCFDSHTNEQLDEKVNEMYAHYRVLEEDPDDYGENQGRAFERDDHTCQLCGNEGIPKAERGLIAYPVCAGDYHLDNLITICDDCLTETLDSDENEQTAADRLRIRAARAQEWTDAEESSDDADETEGGDTAS